MKKETAFLSLVVTGALVAIACQSRPEVGSAAPTAVTADGGATTSVFTVPAPSPLGPGPSGPTGPGPSGPIGPAPGASPASTVYPGYPATPTPTPTPTATPGTTPTPGGTPAACVPGPYSFVGPASFPQAGADGPPEQGPVITVNLPPSAASCFVDNVVTRLQIHSLFPSVGFGGTSPKVVMIKAGNTTGVVLVSLIESDPIFGSQIGTTCSGLTFSNAAPSPFSAATQPYNGTFKPSDAVGMPAFSTVEMNGEWSLQLSNLNGPVVIDCWSIAFNAVVANPAAPIIGAQKR